MPSEIEVKYFVNEDGCWIVTSHKSRKGGQIVIYRNKIEMTAAKYFYIKKFGEIPNGMIVKHKCKNTTCCNPEHIYLDKNKREISYEVDKKNCWNITSHAKNKDGYHFFRIKGKYFYLHRYFYQEKYGEISSDIILRHKCDNPSCVNPEHLEAGTHSDNVKDRVERKRSAIGINNGRSKLNENDVRYIRENMIMNNKELAEMFNVDPKVIRDVKKLKIWKHVK